MINKDDLKLISLLHLNPALGFDKAASFLKRKVHSVRYQFDCLKAEGIVTSEQPFINTYKIGFLQYEIYMSTGFESENVKSLFINFLKNSNNIPWVGEFVGSYQYGFTFCCERYLELLNFLEDLSRKFGKFIYDKEILTRIYYAEFPIRKFNNLRYNPQCLIFGIEQDIERIDQIDHKILKSLSNISNIRLLEIAKDLNISNQALHLRIKKLKQKNIIAGNTLMFNFEKLELLTFKLLFKLNNFDLNTKKEIFKFAQKEDCFLYVIECVGRWDIELGIVAKNSLDFSKIFETFINMFGQKVTLFNVLTTSRYHKAIRYPFA